MPNDVKVHVIDDDDALRQSLQFLLESASMKVAAYESAAAFLDALPDIVGGCVITDVRMPGMSGIELLKRLKEMKIGLPVIVITGHGDVPLAVEAMKGGAVDFIEKPFDDEVLLSAVHAALRRQEQAQCGAGRNRRAPGGIVKSRTAGARWPGGRSPE